jgi:lipopolysaccharide transport system ATP-binding protein
MSSDPKTPVISLDNVSKTYLLYPSPASRLKQFLFRGMRNYFQAVDALKPLTLTLHKGETVGIVGRNGSGKSTLLQLICGTLATTTGTMNVHGKVAALLELGAGFNMEFSGRENIYLNGSVMGLTQAKIKEKESYIEQFANIGHFIEQPVKTYSSGMIVRLAFAIATAVDPDIFIVDEALAVGDEAFQRKCYARIREMQAQGCTILFVSHASQSVVDLCDRALLLDRGELLLDATPKQVTMAYHQMIYAAPEIQESVREHILSKGWSEEPAKKKTETNVELAQPESKTEYNPDGGIITYPRILDAHENIVQVLTCGESYTYVYDVEFTKTLENVRFGMMIKTPTGFELCGAAGAGDVLYVKQVENGQRVRVQFSFRCPFLSGNYFLNCGVTRLAENHQEVFVHRIVDAYQFRVVNEEFRHSQKQLEKTGFLDASIVVSCIS